MKFHIKKANTHPSVAKNQHLLPRTYMKQWVIDSNETVLVFDKRCMEQNLKNRNVSTLNYLSNYYDIKAGDIFVPDEALDEIFGFLDGLNIVCNHEKEEKIDEKAIIVYEEVPLKNKKQLNEYFYEYDNWIIKDEEGTIATKKEKNEIKREICQARYTFIEEEWDKQYENHWISYIESIEKKIRNSVTLSEDEVYKMMEYLIIFDFRNVYGNARINELFKYILPNEFDNIIIPKEERVHFFNQSATDEFKHANRIRAYYDYLKNKKGNMSIMLKKYIENFGIQFWLTDESHPFITSERPSMVIVNKNKEKVHLFVAKPTLLITIYKKNNQLKLPYKVRKMNESMVLEYNRYIAKGANLLISNIKDFNFASLLN